MHQYFAIGYLVIQTICFISILVRRKNLGYWFWPFLLLIGITVIVEYTAFYFLYYKGRSGTFIYHFYFPVAFLLIGFIYLKAINTKWKRWLIIFSVPAFLIADIYLISILQSLDDQNAYGNIAAFFLIVFFSLLYLHELLVKLEVERFSFNPIFWFSIGNVFFYSGAFLLFGLLDYLFREEPVLVRKLYYLIYFLNYILYSLYTVGFLCSKQERKS